MATKATNNEDRVQALIVRMRVIEREARTLRVQEEKAMHEEQQAKDALIRVRNAISDNESKSRRAHEDLGKLLGEGE